jgi:hypothetical protein
MVKDGGDVVCVPESSCCAQAQEESINVIVVSFRTPELRGKRPESV